MRMSSWADLLPELLQSILSRLFGKDVPMFRAVCRQWNSIPSPEINRRIHAPISDIIKHPVLLRYHPDDYCELYSPAYTKTYSLNALPSLRDTQIHSFNHGWLLLSRTLTNLFFLQPSTGDIIRLPKYNYPQKFNVMGFSAPPTSPNCVVVGLVDLKMDYTAVYICFIRRGDSAWRDYSYSFNYAGYPNWAKMQFYKPRLLARYSDDKWRSPQLNLKRCLFRPSPCLAKTRWCDYLSAPVFHKGAFYCISQEGQLGVFDPWKKKKRNMWKVIDVKCRTAFYTHLHSEAYLMESSKGELLSVLVGPDGEYVQVFRYSHVLRMWQSLDSIGDQVAFLSPTSSMVLSCNELQVKGFENTIHFSRFHGIDNVFYSLSTKQFHSFKNGYTSPDLSDTEFRLNSTWMVPKFQCHTQTPLWEDDSGGADDHIELDPSHCISDLGFSSMCKKSSGGPGDQMIMMIEQSARPWIVLTHKENRGGRTFVDLVNRTFHTRETMEACLIRKQVYGVAYRRVVLADVKSGEWALLDTSSMAMDALPEWKIPKDFRKYGCAIHLPSGDSRFVVAVFGAMLTDGHRNMMTFCRVGDKEWTTHMDGPLVDSVVSYRGKIYACGWKMGGGAMLYQIQPRRLNGAQVVELVKLPKYDLMGCRMSSRYLVESCGHLILFDKFMSDKDGQFEFIMGARAYRLDEETMRWEALHDLGDMVFFFGSGNGFGYRASGSCFPRNSLYFINESTCEIIRYNYENHSISTVLSCRDEVEDCSVDELVMC